MRWAGVDAVAPCSISGGKKKKRLGLSWYPLKVNVNSFLSHFFVCAGFVKVRNNGTTRKTKDMSYNRGPLTTPHCLSPVRQSGNMCTFSFLKGKSIDWEMIVLQICLRRTFPHSTWSMLREMANRCTKKWRQLTRKRFDHFFIVFHTFSLLLMVTRAGANQSMNPLYHRVTTSNLTRSRLSVVFF